MVAIWTGDDWKRSGQRDLEENSSEKVWTINNRNQIQNREIQSKTNLNGGELERIKGKKCQRIWRKSVKKDN